MVYTIHVVYKTYKGDSERNLRPHKKKEYWFLFWKLLCWKQVILVCNKYFTEEKKKKYFSTEKLFYWQGTST